jgi:hypothetical protein
MYLIYLSHKTLCSQLLMLENNLIKWNYDTLFELFEVFLLI